MERKRKLVIIPSLMCTVLMFVELYMMLSCMVLMAIRRRQLEFERRGRKRMRIRVPSFEGGSDDEHSGARSDGSYSVSQCTSHTSKKRKLGGDSEGEGNTFDPLEAMMEKMCEDLRGFMGSARRLFAATASAMEHEAELNDMPSKVIQELLSMEGLTEEEIMKVGPIIVGNQAAFFCHLPPNMKKDFVHRLLKGKTDKPGSSSTH